MVLTKDQVDEIFKNNAFDAVMHFAAVAYVGESTLDPLRYAFIYFHTINYFYPIKISIPFIPSQVSYSSVCTIQFISNFGLGKWKKNAWNSLFGMFLPMRRFSFMQA